MQFAHAFWSKPLYNKKFASFEMSLANTLLDYAYSVDSIHRFGHKITLYADKAGIQLLSNIPYDNVVEISVPDDESFHFAASIKFYALQKMNLHEILIDGDIFLESDMVYSLLKNAKQDIIYSFYESEEYVGMVGSENDSNYFKRLLEKFSTVEKSLLYALPEYNHLSYPNTSCIEINSQELKDTWINSYFYHKELLKNIDFDDTWPDMIIEQYMLGQILNDNSNTFNYKEIVPNYPTITPYVKKLGFTHLGSTKTKMLPIVRNALFNQNRELSKKILEQYTEMTGKYI